MKVNISCQDNDTICMTVIDEEEGVEQIVFTTSVRSAYQVFSEGRQICLISDPTLDPEYVPADWK